MGSEMCIRDRDNIYNRYSGSLLLCYAAIGDLGEYKTCIRKFDVGGVFFVIFAKNNININNMNKCDVLLY